MSVRSKILQAAGFAGLGAAAAYFFDPDRGPRRRNTTRDQVISRARHATTDVEQQARYFRGQLEGARARADGRGELNPEDDHLVKQGIDQRLSAAQVDTEKIVIDVTDGVVGLRGQVPDPRQMRKVELEAAAVPGVDEVHSFLHLPGEDAPNKALALKAT